MTSYDFIIKEQHAVPADLSVTAAGLDNINKIDTAVNATPAAMTMNGCLATKAE